ncbi:MAG: protein kinase [Acidobacteria bacterium]|nr:protein kinase [Acidobacteriota bacterium]
MANPNPKRIGKYEVIEIIGRGGMGLVYRAYDRQLDRKVAIKTITEGFVEDQEMLARFYREATKTAALMHPNIVIVYDVGEQEGFPYIVMEYLPGEPLDKLIRAQQPLPLEVKLRILEQVCNALGYAHHNEVIHRDVKPGNVIVHIRERSRTQGQDDVVAKLLDFGIASTCVDGQLTGTGRVIGTLPYMAPERLRCRAFDGRSDIFSAGILLFQVLTGSLPFSGDDYGVMQQLLNEKHPLLGDFIHDYPPALDAILDKALAKDPSDRFASAEEMAEELSALRSELKRGQLAELFRQAQELVHNQQLAEARDGLQQILKIDSQYARARELLAYVQQSLAKQQRAEQLRQLRSQAEELIKQKRFADAITGLQETLRLDPSNAELSQMLQSAQEKKRVREQLDNYLRQADRAREKGDLKNAHLVMAKALEIDQDDSRVRAVFAALTRQVEELERQVKVKRLVESARAEIDAHRFTAALDILNEAERIDPSNPSIIALLRTASLGREQGERHRILEQIQTEVAVATTVQELLNAAKLVDEALQRFPTEPMLLKFKVQLAGTIKKAEVRKHIDEVIQRCRALLEVSPRDALDILTEELRKYPADDRLLSMQSSVETHLSHWTREKARAGHLASAHKALERGEYSEAIRLLQNCQAEGVFSEEIKDLLDFASREAERQKRQQQRQKLLQDAQELMKKGEYDAAVKLLAPESVTDDDPAVRALIEKAARSRNALLAKTDAIVTQLGQLMDQEQYEEALNFAQAQPSEILQSPPLQSMLVKLHQACDRDSVEIHTIARTYAALGRLDLKEAWKGIHSLQQRPSSSFLGRTIKMFEDRCRSIADEEVSRAIQKSKGMLKKSPDRATEIIGSVGPIAPYASQKVQAGWRSARRKITFTRKLRGLAMRRGGSRWRFRA